MLHHESLCLPFQGAVGVGHDFVARQCREVREKSRVDKWGKGKGLDKGTSKMRLCIHWEMGADWGGWVRSFPVEWYDVRSPARVQRPMAVGCPRLEQSVKGRAEAG